MVDCEHSSMVRQFLAGFLLHLMDWRVQWPLSPDDSHTRSLPMQCLLGLIVAIVPVFAMAESPTRIEDDKKDDGVIHLFNGKDLTNFYTYLAAPNGEKQKLGKNNDTKKVF